jgi:hypothetical protein
MSRLPGHRRRGSRAPEPPRFDEHGHVKIDVPPAMTIRLPMAPMSQRAERELQLR